MSPCQTPPNFQLLEGTLLQRPRHHWGNLVLSGKQCVLSRGTQFILALPKICLHQDSSCGALWLGFGVIWVICPHLLVQETRDEEEENECQLRGAKEPASLLYNTIPLPHASYVPEEVQHDDLTTASTCHMTHCSYFSNGDHDYTSEVLLSGYVLVHQENSSAPPPFRKCS